MRFMTSGLVLASLILAVGSSWSQRNGAEKEAVKKERARMKGAWKVVSFEIDGNKPRTADDLKKLLVTIDAGGKITVRLDGKTIIESTNKIDPTKTPKTLDQTFTKGGGGKGKTSLAIYELKGDTFKLCAAAPGDPRPTEFSSKGNTLVVYKRQKDK
jgi:uncharacterized protein (TIGR03067 family)